jgi:hypothetical protein
MGLLVCRHALLLSGASQMAWAGLPPPPALSLSLALCELPALGPLRLSPTPSASPPTPARPAALPPLSRIASRPVHAPQLTHQWHQWHP